MGGPQGAHSMVRRLGEASDLSWMDDSTDQGGPQAPRTGQAGICGQNFSRAKSEAEVEQGYVGWGAVGVDWEETGTWGRSSPGLPGLISLRLSLYGQWAWRRGQKLLLTRWSTPTYSMRRSSEPCMHRATVYGQVLLHGGNTAGLAYSILICAALPCPALPCPALLCCDGQRRAVLRQRVNKGSNRGLEDGTRNLTAIGRPGSGGSGVPRQTVSSLPVCQALPAPKETRFCAGRVRSGAMLQVLESCVEMRQTARIRRSCAYSGGTQ